MKNKKALALLFTANGISGFAQGVSLLSIPWYFAQQDLSNKFNLAYAIITFLTMFWGLVAGTIVDRFPRKRVFLGTNLTEGLIVGVIALYGWYLGDLPEIFILIVFAITLFGFYIHYPNLYAFAQEISPPEQYTRITSWIEIVGQSTNVVAGALAAVLLEGVNLHTEVALPGITIPVNIVIEKWTIYEVFTMDACTYGLSLILIAAMKYVPYDEREVELGSFVKRLRSGFSYLMANKLILLFGFFSYSVFVVMLVKLNAMMPIYIDKHLNEGGDVYGIMEMLYAVGALSAGIFISSLVRGMKVTKAIIMLMLLATTALWLSAFTQSTKIFFTVGLMIGFANAGARVLRLTYIFNHVPNYIVGRVNSLFSLTNVLMRTIFISIFSFTWFSEGSNITWAYFIMGCFTLFSGLMLALNYKKLVTKD
ncbi:MFS transporter [Roseivirga sp. BDSF3-8]|uniref:MFS transporter n=1 Tax=Roseivirga sp. BDSF3-8 TaxID=3241598 RepID=UPI003531B251